MEYFNRHSIMNYKSSSIPDVKSGQIHPRMKIYLY